MTSKLFFHLSQSEQRNKLHIINILALLMKRNKLREVFAFFPLKSSSAVNIIHINAIYICSFYIVYLHMEIHKTPYLKQ